MTAKSILFFCFTTIFFILVSCNDNLSKKELHKQLIKSDKGIIRGVEINNSINLVKKQENNAFLVSESLTHLEYEYAINEIEFIVVAYHFDKKGCAEINVDTYFNSEEKTEAALMLYQSYFSKKYGKPVITEGLYLWKNKSITIEADLIDKKDGEIMLTIYAKE